MIDIESHAPWPASTAATALLESLFLRDASGRTWLPSLLAATEGAASRLGALDGQPGWLHTSLAVRGPSGRLACFEYPVAPSPDLLLWLVEHPDVLVPQPPDPSPSAARLRHALLDDAPPGARARAQERARERARTASAFTSEWWRFEAPGLLDCVLITERLVVTVQTRGADPIPPATPWYPQRTVLARTIEAARQIAQDRAWACLLLSDTAGPDGARDAVVASLTTGAPHLDDAGRDELARAYLGELTVAQARAAVS